MEKIHLTTFIDAPREKVWDTMLSDATYRDWTSVFHPGSYFEGSWEEGSEIRFLGPNPEKPDAPPSGMISRIAVSRRPEYVSIEHLGMIKEDGTEDRDSDMVKKWAGVHENYTFNEKDGGTELAIDMDITPEEKPQMEEMWQNALVRLKELAEAEG